ncbi:hypothetical protein [Marinomonas atlantica]|uniref:hypothetical protein n=1 Tax=Marinomonas atlantica TaxID=1806668 RepID=UPI000832162B|nr:hypothetical protein [Marinomonas atlantica]
MLPCLPNEPRIVDPKLQGRLTDEYLSEYQPQIEQLFTELRRQLNVHLRNAKPIKLGKAYPLGQCLEISQAFEVAFAQLEPSKLSTPEHVIAFQAIKAFIAAGGEFRQVWGDLRGEYFQNAFLLGSWYVDVANDTVDRNKPSVEVLPFAESGLRPIQNFAHFAVIAKRYWGAASLPNIVYPELAPYVPLIILQPNAGPQLHGMFDYMIALTQRSEFAMSEQAISELSFPEHLYEAFAAGGDQSIEQARSLALKACQKARAVEGYLLGSARDSAIQKALLVNQHWTKTCVQFG